MLIFTDTPAVKRGARELDRIKPEWFRLVDIEHLHMSSPLACIAGQVFAKESRRSRHPTGYEFAIHALGLDATKCGFYGSEQKQLWIAEIQARLDAAEPARRWKEMGDAITAAKAKKKAMDFHVPDTLPVEFAEELALVVY